MYGVRRVPICIMIIFFLMIRRPPRSTLDRSSAASDVYKRQTLELLAERYPESEYAPQALVTAARVSEENVNNIERSIKYLQQIKDKYPESPYATNIDLQIEYAGDDEALLDAIMERNGVDLDSLLEAADSIDAVKK